MVYTTKKKLWFTVGFEEKNDSQQAEENEF